jgi:hypothetical protein
MKQSLSLPKEVLDTFLAKNNTKYDLMYNFGGGLGDVIKHLFNNSLYDQIIEKSKDKKIIINLYCTNPFARELFYNIPNKQNIKINIFDDVCEVLVQKMTRDQREKFLKEFNSEEINLDGNSSYIEKRKKNGHVNFFLSDEEEELITKIINDIKKENKKILIFCPFTGKTRTTPTKEYCDKVVDFINNDFFLLKVGRDFSLKYNEKRYDKEYLFKQEKVKDLTNKLSVPATLELVKRSDGIVTSDTSILCYGDILDKPMFIMISDKNIEHYKNYNQYHYYLCFDKENVIFQDWKGTDQESINKFLKLL